MASQPSPSSNWQAGARKEVDRGSGVGLLAGGGASGPAGGEGRPPRGWLAHFFKWLAHKARYATALGIAAAMAPPAVAVLLARTLLQCVVGSVGLVGASGCGQGVPGVGLASGMLLLLDAAATILRWQQGWMGAVGLPLSPPHPHSSPHPHPPLTPTPTHPNSGPGPFGAPATAAPCSCPRRCRGCSTSSSRSTASGGWACPFLVFPFLSSHFLSFCSVPSVSFPFLLVLCPFMFFVQPATAAKPTSNDALPCPCPCPCPSPCPWPCLAPGGAGCTSPAPAALLPASP